jgi:hypothetical protein
MLNDQKVGLMVLESLSVVDCYPVNTKRFEKNGEGRLNNFRLNRLHNEERAYNVFGCFVSDGRTEKNVSVACSGFGLTVASIQLFRVVCGATNCISWKTI